MATPGKPTKQTAWRFGQVAETIAVWTLRAKGYRILARQFRCRAGEIDIVARRGRQLAFIEVKARRDASTAAEALRPRQAERIVRAAEAFVQSHPSLAAMDQRFDVILVVPGRWPVHLVDAWRPGF